MSILVTYLNLVFCVVLPAAVAVYALWHILKWRRRCRWLEADEIDYYGGDQWPHH